MQQRTFRHEKPKIFRATFQLQYSRLARYSRRNTPYCASAYCSLYLPLAALTNAPFEGRQTFNPSEENELENFPPPSQPKTKDSTSLEMYYPLR